MAEQPPPEPHSRLELRRRLQELGRLLRQAKHLEPEAQQELANVVDELGQALESGDLESGTTSHLADSTGRLVEALREQHKGLLASARDGLERVVVQAEGEAPVATGFAQRLIEVLSNLGI
jgi:hypothetical protein